MNSCKKVTVGTVPNVTFSDNMRNILSNVTMETSSRRRLSRMKNER